MNFISLNFEFFRKNKTNNGITSIFLILNKNKLEEKVKKISGLATFSGNISNNRVRMSELSCPTRGGVILLLNLNIINYISGMDEGSPEINNRLLPTNNIYWKCFHFIILFWNRRLGRFLFLQGSKGDNLEERRKILRNVGFKIIL